MNSEDWQVYSVCIYCNFLVLLSTTVCSQNINKQIVNIADENLTNYRFLSRYHYTKSKNYLKRRYRVRHAQQEKIQRTEEKRCTVNHVAEFVKRNSDSQRTEVQRLTKVKTLRCTERCTERSDLRSPFLLLFWSSVSTPLLEFRYYSSFGAPFLEHCC